MNLNQIVDAVKIINSEIKDCGFFSNENKNIQSLKTEFENNLYDLIIQNEGLIKKTRKLFIDGHHAEAVEKSYKYLNNIIKKFCKEDKKDGKDGAKLMNYAFTPSAPIIKLNSLSNDSENDEQLGFMQILSGCMTGIRNPRAHESDWEDTESNALYMISFADFLINKILKAIGKDK